MSPIPPKKNGGKNEVPRSIPRPASAGLSSSTRRSFWVVHGPDRQPMVCRDGRWAGSSMGTRFCLAPLAHSALGGHVLHQGSFLGSERMRRSISPTQARLREFCRTLLAPLALPRRDAASTSALCGAAMSGFHRIEAMVGQAPCGHWRARVIVHWADRSVDVLESPTCHPTEEQAVAESVQMARDVMMKITPPAKAPVLMPDQPNLH